MDISRKIDLRKRFYEDHKDDAEKDQEVFGGFDACMTSDELEHFDNIAW
jgi:hypothetical protein